MKSIDTPRPESTRRVRFNYEPDRHYVLVQKAGGQWEENTLDKLLDQWDEEANAPAYRVEADGDTDSGRQVTRDRRLVLLSCSKSFNERRTQEHVAPSNAQAYTVEPETADVVTKLERRSAISIDDIQNRI